MKNILIALVICALVYFTYTKSILLGIALTLFILIYFITKKMPVIMQFRSRKYSFEGDYKTARDILQKVASKPTATDDVKIEYSYILMRTGQFEEAEQILNNILSKPVDNSLRGRAVLQRCLCYYKQDNLSEALEDAYALYNEGFRSMTLYGLLGYFKVLDNPRSQETFDFCMEAYEYASDDRDICDNLLICYYNRGEYEKAKEISNSVLENNPKFVEAWYHAAQIDVKLGDYESAKEKLDKIEDCNRSYMTTISVEEVNNLMDEVSKKLEVNN